MALLCTPRPRPWALTCTRAPYLILGHSKMICFNLFSSPRPTLTNTCVFRPST
ncbi:hypothetical protein IC575_031138 [Cucumis melo]